MRSKERNPIFLAYLLVIVAALTWFIMSGRVDDKDKVRIAAVSSIRSIATHNATGICNHLSPQLVGEIYDSNFQALGGIPKKGFCVLAAQQVFELYGDYYISGESMGSMVASKIQVSGNKATVWFDDGQNKNVSHWIKETGSWKMISGIKELVAYVAGHDNSKAMANDMLKGLKPN